MATTTLTLTLDEALASRLTTAAQAQGIAPGVLAAACVEQHLDIALRHLVLLQRQDVVDRQIAEIAAFIEEASSGGGLDPVDLFRIYRYPRDEHVTASLHKLGSGRGAGAYYTSDSRREAKPRNRDEYYTRDSGGGGGTWWSTGETVVRHGAAVELATFQDLCAGFDPRTGAPLVRNAGPDHLAGLDCTMTLGKSASVLWMAGTPTQRAIIEDAHRSAVDQALRLIEREGWITVRSGAGGQHRDQPSDIIVAQFDHYTTREGDPNLHTHNVIINLAGSSQVSKRYKSHHLAIETAGCFHNVRTIGAAYRAAAAEQLARHGFAFREAGQGQWEIAGIPQAILATYSKRSAQIDALVGRNATAAQREIAALATRQAKEHVPSGAELEARWREELAAHAADPWTLALSHTVEHGQSRERDNTLDPAMQIDPPEIAGATPVAVAASALFRHESVITRAALLEAALIEAGQRGIGIDPVYAEMERLEQDGTLLRLGSDQGDGQRWTTPSIARVEADMLRAANRPTERAWFRNNAVDSALEEAAHLSAERRDAVRLATSSNGISIIEAGAGTGKTTAAQAIRDSADRSGLTVIGLAPSWVAANELGQSIGVPAQAIAKWRHDRERGTAPPLNERTVLLVDEAGMASMRDMAAIVVAAMEARTKLILLGDSGQLEAVPGGSALRAIRELVRQNAVMEAVRRQEVGWQRAASVVMARGDAEAGLRAYAARGHLEMVGGTGAAMGRVVEQWRALRAEHGDDVLIITRRNADAATLNQAVRESLRSEARLAGDDVVLRFIDREKKQTQLHLSVGDIVRFGQTLPDLQIWNGNRGTVEAIRVRKRKEAVIRIRMEDGRVIEQPWSGFARKLPGLPLQPPRVVHAYAGTAYSVQGRTAAASVHYVGAGTDARETYVALTRHRRDVRVVVERDRLDAACRLRQADRRVAPTLVDLEERLFREASQYSEKANVVDLVADRQAFIATGVVTRPEIRPDRSVTRLMQAARALRDALRDLTRVELAVPAWRLVENGIRLLAPMPARLRDAVARARQQTAVRQDRAPTRDHGIER